MLNLSRIALIFLLLASFDYARATCPPAVAQPTAEMAQDAALKAKDHGFLWRISKGGATSYLYGTIHVAKFSWMFPGPKVSQALSETDTIALELDMLDTDIQGRISQGMASLPQTQTTDALKIRIRKQAELLCFPYDSISSLTPEFQVTTLTMMVGRSLGLEPGYAIDGVLAGIGHHTHKNMVSLESPEMQLQLLQMNDAAETTAFLDESLKELETGQSLKLLNKIAQYWSEANYAKMEQYEAWCDCLNTEMDKEVMKRALDERNPALAERIDQLHKDGHRVFAAVGSLHMFGAIGLPALMEKRGYQVDRINFE